MRVFVALFLMVQVTFPLVGLAVRGGLPFSPGNLTDWPGQQVYFAWQMYSTSTTPVIYEVVEAGGATLEVDPVERYGWLEGRAHYTGAVARRLCVDHPDAVEVRHADRLVRCGDG